MLDLDAYLARIGLSGQPGLAELHRAHVASIPFENLDPQRGIPVSLAPEDLERKLVRQRRSGYCFEQNLLLKTALEALGDGRVRVELLLARVRAGAPPGSQRPRTHLVLRVRTEEGDWHGTRVSLSDWDGLAFCEKTPAGRSARAVERREIGELIARHFGLDRSDGH